MLSRQLSGLLVTCMKLLQVVSSRELRQGSVRRDYGLLQAVIQGHVIGDILTVSSQAVKLLSLAATNPARGAAPSKAAASSDSSDAGQLWAVVAGRALRSLGQLMSAAAEVGTLPSDHTADDRQNVHDRLSKADPRSQLLMQTLWQEQSLADLLPHLSASSRMFVTAARIVEWLMDSLKTCSTDMPSSVQEQLLQQQKQLVEGLEVADFLVQAAMAAGRPVQTTGEAQAIVQPLPQLLITFGSTACAWLPQQQWCTNLQCQNLGMLRENVTIVGQGKVCSGCCSVRYCSRECQVQDWKDQHKQACSVLKAAFRPPGRGGCCS